MATMLADTMLGERSFILKRPIHRLKSEAIDRLDSIVDDLPKYKKKI